MKPCHNPFPVALLGNHGPQRAHRESTVRSAGFQLVELSDVGSFLEVEKTLQPTALLISVEHDTIEPEQLLEALARRRCAHAAAFLGSASPERVLAAVRAGAVDWTPVDSAETLIALAERTAARARRRGWDMVTDAGQPELERLTPREHETLELVLEGHPSKAIAPRLGVTTKTVEQHRSNVMHQLGVASVAQLVLRSMKTRTYGVAHLANPRRG